MSPRPDSGAGGLAGSGQVWGRSGGGGGRSGGLAAPAPEGGGGVGDGQDDHGCAGGIM